MRIPVNKGFPPGPLTYLITSGELTDSNFNEKKSEIIETLRAAVETGIKLFQIREKQLSAKLLFDLALEAGAMSRGMGTRLLINDRADIALAAKADGVHLPANSVRADVIRRSFPKGFLIGVSTHSLAAAQAAARQGVDFVTFGPVFETPDKGEPTGLAVLQHVCESLDHFPVIALGGINESNWKSTIDSGARGFAAIRFLNNAANLRRLVHDFVDD